VGQFLRIAPSIIPTNQGYPSLCTVRFGKTANCYLGFAQTKTFQLTALVGS